MSTSVDLQTLIYDRLVADAGVHAVVKDRIYDRVPEKGFFPYITIGTGFLIEDDADCITGVVEITHVQVWSRKQGGFKEAKQGAAAVKQALHLYSVVPDNSALVDLRLLTIAYLDDLDGITKQANLRFQAIMEE